MHCADCDGAQPDGPRGTVCVFSGAHVDPRMGGLSFGCPRNLSIETSEERAVSWGVLKRARDLHQLDRLLLTYPPAQRRDLQWLATQPENDHAVRGQAVDDDEARRRYVEGYGGMAVTG